MKLGQQIRARAFSGGGEPSAVHGVIYETSMLLVLQETHKRLVLRKNKRHGYAGRKY